LKFLLFLCVTLFGVWLWRKNRLNDLKQRSEKTVDPQTPQAKQPSAMLACLHCGVHMPEVDMYRGKKAFTARMHIAKLPLIKQRHPHDQRVHAE